MIDGLEERWIRVSTMPDNHHKDVAQGPAFDGLLLVTTVHAANMVLESKGEGHIKADFGTPRDCYHWS